MSEQYTPRTDEVRDHATENAWHGFTAAEFDRWLDRERAAARREGQAEAWDEAVKGAHLHETEHFISIKHGPNPYEGYGRADL